MDHSEATKIKAVEKYILGELPSELREQFEEHYVDCPECASDVRALARFRTVGRLLLEEDPAGGVPSTERRRPLGWQNWLRPVFAAPAIVAPTAKSRCGTPTRTFLRGLSSQGRLAALSPWTLNCPQIVSSPITVIRTIRFSGCFTRRPMFPKSTTLTISSCRSFARPILLNPRSNRLRRPASTCPPETSVSRRRKASTRIPAKSLNRRKRKSL